MIDFELILYNASGIKKATGGGGGGSSTFTLAADTGSPETVEDSDTLSIVGGTAIQTAVSAPDTITIAVAVEVIQDMIASFLAAGANISLSYNDAGDSLTIAVTGLDSGDISDFAEAVDDRVNTLLVGGTDISLTYDDEANTLTIAYTGSGGGGAALFVSDGTTDVDPTELLNFDPDFFGVSDQGGGAAGLTFVGTAADIEYTPDEGGDWEGPPTEVGGGLDELAARVADLESSGGGGGGGLPQGYINGFQVNVTGTDVTIKPGTCRSDDNTTDLTRTTSAGDITVDPDSTGANGLDTGSPANNTWYYVYVIWNGSTIAGLMSTSTSPTMPSGYTKKRRVGAVRTNGSAALFKQETITREARREVIYLEDVTAAPFLIMSNGAVSTSGTWDSKDASAIVPPTAREARMYFNSNTPSNAFTLNYRMNSNQIWRILGAQLNTEQYNFIATLPLTSSQTFEITQATGGTVTEDLSIQVHGYVDDLAVGYV